jgi:ATP-dependent exoDNAse (exonuclease V) beta subunit
VNRTKSLQAIVGILESLSGGGSDSALTALTLCCQGKPQTDLVTSAFRSFCKDKENLPPKCVDLLKAFPTNQPSKDFQLRAIVQTLLTRLQKIQKQCTVSDKIRSIVSLFKLRKAKDVEEFISLARSADSEESALKVLSEHEMKSRNTVTDAVYVGTIHSAKGQQWPTVILPLLNEGTVPRENTDHREERRVLYVGVTRAISALILTCSSGPNSRPSPFLLDASVSTTKQVSEILSLICEHFLCIVPYTTG